MKAPRLLLVLVFCLMHAVVARAHPVPFSYVDLRLHGTVVEADVIVHVYDAAHDLGIARPLPEKYKGYSSQVPSLFGGPAGRIKRLQDEMK